MAAEIMAPGRIPADASVGANHNKRLSVLKVHQRLGTGLPCFTARGGKQQDGAALESGSYSALCAAIQKAMDASHDLFHPAHHSILTRGWRRHVTVHFTSSLYESRWTDG